MTVLELTTAAQLFETNSVRVRHKTEGWTGTITVDEPSSGCCSWGSHSQYFTAAVDFRLSQDAYDENGKYWQDPDATLAELEIIPC